MVNTKRSKKQVSSVLPDKKGEPSESSKQQLKKTKTPLLIRFISSLMFFLGLLGVIYTVFWICELVVQINIKMQYISYTDLPVIVYFLLVSISLVVLEHYFQKLKFVSFLMLVGLIFIGDIVYFVNSAIFGKGLSFIAILISILLYALFYYLMKYFKLRSVSRKWKIFIIAFLLIIFIIPLAVSIYLKNDFCISCIYLVSPPK